MAIYKTKKLSFVKNRFRDLIVIVAFYLGYYTHDRVDYYVNKIKEYQSVLEAYEINKVEKINHQYKIDNNENSSSKTSVETIVQTSTNTIEEDNVKEVKDEPVKRYPRRYRARRRARVIRKQN